MKLKQEKRVSKPELLPEKQQLVAGVFASRVVADAAMKKIEGLGLQLQRVNASYILLLTRDDAGKSMSASSLSVRVPA